VDFQSTALPTELSRRFLRFMNIAPTNHLHQVLFANYSRQLSAIISQLFKNPFLERFSPIVNILIYLAIAINHKKLHPLKLLKGGVKITDQTQI
jgi:hypothetical protein